jgi:DNA-binding transcriptional LysR family regulator
MQLDDVGIFVRVVQAGSFTKAAATLGLTKSTVSARVMALEQAVGVTLLHRTTRAMSLTNDGAAFFAASSAALDAVEAAAAEASHGRGELQGIIRVTAPAGLGTHLLPKFIADFLQSHRALKLKLSLTNRFVDLIGEGIDVAIRAGALEDSGLSQRRIGTSSFSLYASRSYLKRHGMPKDPEHLSKHRRLSFEALGNVWKLVRGKETVTVQGDAHVVADDLVAIKEMAAAGIGVALVPAFIATEDVKHNRLAPVLREWRAHETGVYIVLPGHKIRHPRIQAFVNAAAEWLSQRLD